MKYTLLFILTLVIYPRELCAQRIDPKVDPHNFSKVMVANDSELYQVACDISKFEVLDSAVLSITYLKLHVQDSVKRVALTDTMRLDVGGHYSVFYSRRVMRMDSIYTANHFLAGTGNIGNYDGGRYYFNRQTNVCRVVNRMPFIENVAIEYTEPRPTCVWMIHDECSREILGVGCLKATTFFRGRSWTVWFAQTIPINVGPWKFSGLPGAILCAEDEKREYVFEAIGITQLPAIICDYKWTTRRMTRAQWLQYERKMYKAPYNYVGNNGKTLILSLTKHNGVSYLDNDNWSAPYNPIERE